MHRSTIGLVALCAAIASPAAGQHTPDEAAALAVADAALEAISAENMVAFTDLMLEEASTFSTNGEGYGSVSRSAWRARPMNSDFVERGFDPEVRVAGAIASVWMPYDIYIDGEWSHCGVDAFTLIRVDAGWRIAAMAWTIEQPPACEPHPDGPPPGL